MSRVLLSKHGKSKLSVMSGAALHEGNYEHLVNWIFKEFSADSEFIKKVLITKDQVADDILYNMVDDFELGFFIARLNELNCLQGFIKDSFLSKLILWKDVKYGRTFIQHLIKKLGDSVFKVGEAFNSILKILDWIHQNINCLSQLYSSEDKYGKNLVFYVDKIF